MPSPSTVQVDRRRLRGERSRDAIVTALLELYDEGHLRPGAALIAERAGVSQSSVFRHFEDLEGLVELAVERQWQRIRARFGELSPEGTVEQRVDRLIAQRLAIVAVAGPAVRAGRVTAPGSPALARAVRRRRALFRRVVAELFAAELSGLSPGQHRITLDALDAACGFEQLEHLRVDLARSERRVTAQVRTTLLALIQGAQS